MHDTDKLIDLKLIVIISKMMKALNQRLEPEIKEMGITSTQFTVLEVLYNKGARTVNQIIEGTLSSSGNMGVVINNLIRSGLIRKNISGIDRRERVIDLTANGRELISELFPMHVNSISNSFLTLDTDEKEILIKLIKKLGKGLG